MQELFFFDFERKNMRREIQLLLEQLHLTPYSNDYWVLGGAIDAAVDIYMECRPIVIRDVCSRLTNEGCSSSGDATDRRLRRVLERLTYEPGTKNVLDRVLGRSDYETVPLQEFLYAAVRWTRNSLDKDSRE